MPFPAFLRCCLLLCLLSGGGMVKAQLKLFQHEYTNVQQCTYLLNKAISLCSPGGNVPVARALINSGQLEGIDKYLAESVLLYNLYGEGKAWTFLDSLRERKDLGSKAYLYAKLWVCKIVEKKDDYSDIYQEFVQTDSNGLFLLKFKLKEFIYNKKRHPSYLKIYSEPGGEMDRQRLLTKTDSMIADDQLPQVDKVYFSLAQLDLNIPSHLPKEDSTRQVAYKSLCDLWQKFPEQFHGKRLLNELEKCDSEQCLATKSHIKTYLRQQGSMSDRELLYVDLRRLVQATRAERLADLPQRFQETAKRHIDTLPDANEREILKSIIWVASQVPDTKDPTWQMLSFTTAFDKQFAEIPFSPAFRSFLQPSLPMLDLKALVLSESENPEALSQVDVQAFTQEQWYAVLGMATYLELFADHIKEAFGAAHRQIAPSETEKADWKAFEPFLDKNPLYEGRSIYDYPPAFEDEELKTALAVLDRLIAKYPGAEPLKLIRDKYLED